MCIDRPILRAIREFSGATEFNILLQAPGLAGVNEPCRRSELLNIPYALSDFDLRLGVIAPLKASALSRGETCPFGKTRMFLNRIRTQQVIAERKFYVRCVEPGEAVPGCLGRRASIREGGSVSRRVRSPPD